MVFGEPPKSGIVYVDEMRDETHVKEKLFIYHFTIVISGRNGGSSD